MPWNIPANWATNELVTATKMNQQLKDNIAYLKKRPLHRVSEDVASGSTNSTTFAYVGNAMTLSFTPQGPVAGQCLYLIGYGGHVQASAATVTYGLTVEVNGLIDQDYLRTSPRAYVATANMPISWNNIYVFNVGTAYTLRLMWKTDTGTITAASNWYFWALEVGEV